MQFDREYANVLNSTRNKVATVTTGGNTYWLILNKDRLAEGNTAIMLQQTGEAKMTDRMVKALTASISDWDRGCSLNE